jgi:hypothetical protein
VVHAAQVVGHGLAPLLKPARHRVDLGLLGGADLLGQVEHLLASSLVGCQFGYLHCLTVVRDHLGGESDVGGVVVG